MNTPSDGAIRIEDLGKGFGSVQALDDISLSIQPGTYHSLLGPNGSGKSTLMRVILGLTPPDRGSVALPDGVAIGCGFQQPNFYPGLTVRENIRVFASMMGADDWEWNQRVVDELRLNPALDRRAGDLSGGFSRKLDLTLALIKRPEFLLLDEPLGALDDVSKVRMLAFLDEYVEAGNTVFVSSHEVTAFEPYLDRVTLIHDGEIVTDRTLDALDLHGADSLQSWAVETVLGREGVDSFDQSVIE